MFVFTDLDKPISPESPCGPDPEQSPDIQNFLAVAEGHLPASYRDFDKKVFAAKSTLEQLAKYFSESRDIRFLVTAAKYAMLSDDLKLFSDILNALPTLLKNNWVHVHPTESAGGNALRSAFLQSLDDRPTIVFPLQSMPLINDKRIGQISMRTILVADKKIPARPDETVLELDAIKDAFMRFEPLDRMNETVLHLTSVKNSLQQLRDIFQEKAGHEYAPMFDLLPAVADSICQYIGEIHKARMPSEAMAVEDGEVSEGATSEVFVEPKQDLAGDIASVKEASNALEAILNYYAATEPSSPARLLVKQAHQLVGKSFVEAMRILAPGLVDETKIKMGGDQPFALDFNQLSALFGDEASDGISESTEARSFIAASRSEATALMRKIEQFYKVREPSSPIPLLVERARNFVAKDFSSLLKEMAKKDETQ